ncbi:hypothetical protein FQN54_002619 [Arachnomyces sp. PD_36]|nr:hypothetical protein FQN54_002619 [Arachnomyces sp. PD_36]
MAALLVEPVASDSGDDFSNNLFSDLAPVLQLFGEQVAKQFISQSMGWADHITFSMAPLGIITIVIGAIRVAGPTWLKMIIGRARENKAVAEVELMSSTSHEVSEIWNGQALIRTMGMPPIQEMIFFPRRRKEGDFGLQTLEEAKSMGYLQGDELIASRVNKNSTGVQRQRCFTDKGGHSSMALDEDPEEAAISKPRIPTSAPNIFLNIQPRRNRVDLHTTAIIGIVLQLAVLVFAGMTTYYPPWKLQKDGGEIDGYAFPLTAAGTLTLVAGVLICSFVIEQSSKEVDWEANREDCKGARIVWLQRHGVVNDQLFESFAIFARGKRSSVLTSRRIETSASATDSRSMPGGGDGKIPSRLSNLVVVGTLISLIGFVIQFTGLRAMNWSTAIMQLAATLVMAGLRSWVRRDLAEPPITIKIPSDYEVDWLATRLARCQQDNWPDDDESFQNFQHGDWEWSIVKGADTTGEFNRKCEDGASDGEYLAQRVMKVREHLGQLCRWTGPASELAVSVAKSIEDTMNIRFPGEDCSTFTWSLKVKIKANTGQEQSVHFTVRRDERLWVANATELEAALSLWLFATHEEEERQKIKEESKPNKDWLRREEMAVKKQCMRLLCERTTQSVRDFSWWVPGGASQLLSVRQLDSSQSRICCDPAAVVEFDNFRIVENPGCKVQSKSARGTTGYQSEVSEFGTGTPGRSSQVDDQFLAVTSNDTLAVVLARNLFSSFISAIADKIHPIGGNTTVSPVDPTDTDPGAWKSLKLENSVLYQMAQAAERAGLGTLQEAYTCIIPPLHLKKALPIPLDIIDLALGHANPEESAGHWQKAGAIYQWLLGITPTFDPRDDVYIRSIAECMEFCKQLSTTAKSWKRQHHKKEAFRGLENLRLSLLDSLKAMDKEITTHLALMYKQRFALDGLEDLMPDGNEIHPSQSLLEESLGHSPLHQALLSPEPYKTIQANSLIGEDNFDKKDALGWTPLHLAATRGRRRIMSLLLIAGANPNSRNIAGWTPLHYFSFRKNGNPKLAWRFLQRGADVDATGRDGVGPLHCAAMSDNKIMTRLLIESGANIEIQDNSRKTPLHWAAFNGASEVVQILSEKGAYLDSQEYNKRTPLHLAAERGHVGVADQLVQLGANIHAKDKFRYSALHWAAQAGDEKMIEKLLDLGARVNAKNVFAQTALHIAGFEGHEATTEELLRRGADVNAKDAFEKTALHMAAEQGYYKLVVILVGQGADINAKDTAEKTALSYAIERGHEVVARKLRELGAEVNVAENSGSED